MKILVNKHSLALNQIAVQAMFGGMLFALAMVSFIVLMLGFTDWVTGKGEGPLVELLITALLGIMSAGRFNSAERHSESIRELIKED